MAKKIYLDAGHGGSDPGATANGLQEKDVTLSIVLQIRDILNAEYTGHELKLSRSGDTYPTLQQRTDEANTWGADYFLSVHINAGGGTGFESYVYPGSVTSATYQNSIHSEVLKLNQLSDRGQRTGNLHVLRESNMPAILTENGFIDTVADANKMKSAAWITAVARGHVNGLVKLFGLTKKSTAVYHTVVAGDTVYALSLQYGSTVEQIRSWNNLDSNYTIYAGEVLRVK